MRWYSSDCKAREAHTGATRMNNRADALVVMAKVEERAKKHDAFGYCWRDADQNKQH